MAPVARCRLIAAAAAGEQRGPTDRTAGHARWCACAGMACQRHRTPAALGPLVCSGSQPLTCGSKLPSLIRPPFIYPDAARTRTPPSARQTRGAPTTIAASAWLAPPAVLLLPATTASAARARAPATAPPTPGESAWLRGLACLIGAAVWCCGCPPMQAVLLHAPASTPNLWPYFPAPGAPRTSTASAWSEPAAARCRPAAGAPGEAGGALRCPDAWGLHHACHAHSRLALPRSHRAWPCPALPSPTAAATRRASP